MANPSVQSVPADTLRGLAVSLAAGKGVGDFGAIGAGASATMTVADREVRSTMHIFGMIQISADPNLVLANAVAGEGSIVFTVLNNGSGAATAGDTTIAYFAR